MSARAAAGGHPRQSAAEGIAFYATGIFLLCIMDALIKWLAADYPVGQIVFFRSLVGLIPVAAVTLHMGGIERLRTRRLGVHVLRGLIGAVATFAFFYAFALLPLADAYAIGFAAPMFMTALSVPILGEAVGWRRWTAVAVGFAGVLVMVRPAQGGAEGLLGTGAAVALLGTGGYALSMVMMRLFGRTETNEAMVFYATLFVTLAGAATLPFGWVTPDGRDLSLLIALGLLGGIGSLMMAQAFRVATPSIVVPFEYTGMVWGVGFGYFFWDDIPDAWIWAGSALVIGSGLYMLFRETRSEGEVSPLGAALEDSSGEGAPPLARRD
jgi:drug/metabolite transporter (DMT)-like permease